MAADQGEKKRGLAEARGGGGGGKRTKMEEEAEEEEEEGDDEVGRCKLTSA